MLPSPIELHLLFSKRFTFFADFVHCVVMHVSRSSAAPWGSLFAMSLFYNKRRRHYYESLAAFLVQPCGIAALSEVFFNKPSLTTDLVELAKDLTGEMSSAHGALSFVGPMKHVTSSLHSVQKPR